MSIHTYMVLQEWSSQSTHACTVYIGVLGQTSSLAVHVCSDVKLHSTFLQVAHFYNTIDQQMIPSQQAMMLEAAMAFEHIIKNPKAGTKSGSEVSRYTLHLVRHP